MKAEQIKERIAECITMFEFEYNGEIGNVDPYYIPQTNSTEYLLAFGGHEETVYSLDDVMNTPFVEGKTLAEIADRLE